MSYCKVNQKANISRLFKIDVHRLLVVKMTKYLINKDIIFLPEEKILFSIKKNVKFNVHRTGAHCLELLLERQGQLVLQLDLMVAGWGEDAKRTVSNAAYYQALTNLRKILRELGCPDNALMTIRGRGVRLNAYIDVKKTESVKPSVGEDSDIVNHVKNEQTVVDIAAEPDSAASSGDIMQTSPAQENISSGGRNNRVIYRYGFYILIAIVTTCSTVFFWNNKHILNRTHLEGFTHINGTPLCYYVNNRNIDNAFAIDYVSNRNLKCNGDAKYYISYFSTSPRLSVFKCGEDASLNCDSSTYILVKDENH